MTDDVLTAELLPAVLAEVASAAGLSLDDAALIKFTNNAVYRLPSAGAVIRIAGSDAVRARVPHVINVARWLEQHDYPAVRLRQPLLQPIKWRGQVATVWNLVQEGGPKPSGRTLAQLLRLWHGLPPAPFEFPRWGPLRAIRTRIDGARAVSPDDLRFLRDESDAIEEALTSVRYVLPPGPIWGDAFLGNVISGPRGPVACDFDGATFGPREWDLIPLAVGDLRFHYPGNNHQELADGYGFDVTSWKGFAVLRRLRELQLVTSVLPVLDVNPSLANQWRYRLDTYRSGDRRAIWTPYR